MHSAKGLEFDTVFIVGAEEGIFPGTRAIGDLSEMEEERRLCYVAMTRAMRKLYFTSARKRMLFGRTSSSEPSRFVREINAEHIDINEPVSSFMDFESQFTFTPRETGFRSKPQNVYNRPPVIPQKPKAAAPAVSFSKGDTVKHKAFGRGLIINVSPAGGDALLEIAFDEVGTKRLMQNSAARYLEKV